MYISLSYIKLIRPSVCPFVLLSVWSALSVLSVCCRGSGATMCEFAANTTLFPEAPDEPLGA